MLKPIFLKLIDRIYLPRRRKSVSVKLDGEPTAAEQLEPQSVTSA